MTWMRARGSRVVRRARRGAVLAATLAGLLGCGMAWAAGAPVASAVPPTLDSYGDGAMTSLWAVLEHRVRQEPLNLWATLLFLGAVVHTFFTHKFRHLAHTLAERHRASGAPASRAAIWSRVLHFLGEVEAVFGIWVIPLFVLLVARAGFGAAIHYVDERVSYREPLFVVVIMTIASTRPILNLAESGMRVVARLGGGKPAAWWWSILTLGPLLGSFITEPAAMTISALLLGKQFFERKPRIRFAYATLGLLFVNISIGGTLTHFAAPPVLMVAAPWNWGTAFMLAHFGWVAVIGIVLGNALYALVFRQDLADLNRTAPDRSEGGSGLPVPVWVTAGHLGFMVWAVAAAHYPPLVMFCLLFFIAFYEVTEDYQSGLALRPAVLVGFFLAGLVIHGGLQQWWIAPVLSRLGEVPLFLGATALTAFNDNAAITYLATLVPGLTDTMKHAVVAGAVTGGGLTVIANAPNPAGQSILARYFPDGISPLGLLLGALAPTVVVALCFLGLR